MDDTLSLIDETVYRNQEDTEEKVKNYSEYEQELARQLYNRKDVREAGQKALSRVSQLLIRYNRLKNAEELSIETVRDAEDSARKQHQSRMERLDKKKEKAEALEDEAERKKALEEIEKARKAYEEDYQESLAKAKVVGNERLAASLDSSLDNDENGGILSTLMLGGDAEGSKGYSLTTGDEVDLTKGGTYIKDVAGEKGTLFEQMSLLDNAMNTGGIKLPGKGGSSDAWYGPSIAGASSNLNELLRNVTEEDIQNMNSTENGEMDTDINLAAIKNAKESGELDNLIGERTKKLTMKEAFGMRGQTDEMLERKQGKRGGVNDLSWKERRMYASFAKPKSMGNSFFGQLSSNARYQDPEEYLEDIKEQEKGLSRQERKRRKLRRGRIAWQLQMENMSQLQPEPELNEKDTAETTLPRFDSKQEETAQKLTAAGFLTTLNADRQEEFGDQQNEDAVKNMNKDKSARHMLAMYRMLGASREELFKFRLALIAYMVPAGKKTIYEILQESEEAGVKGNEDLSTPETMYATFLDERLVNNDMPKKQNGEANQMKLLFGKNKRNRLEEMEEEDRQSLNGQGGQNQENQPNQENAGGEQNQENRENAGGGQNQENRENAGGEGNQQNQPNRNKWLNQQNIQYNEQEEDELEEQKEEEQKEEPNDNIQNENEEEQVENEEEQAEDREEQVENQKEQAENQKEQVENQGAQIEKQEEQNANAAEQNENALELDQNQEEQNENVQQLGQQVVDEILVLPKIRVLAANRYDLDEFLKDEKLDDDNVIAGQNLQNQNVRNSVVQNNENQEIQNNGNQENRNNENQELRNNENQEILNIENPAEQEMNEEEILNLPKLQEMDQEIEGELQRERQEEQNQQLEQVDNQVERIPQQIQAQAGNENQNQDLIQANAGAAAVNGLTFTPVARKRTNWKTKLKNRILRGLKLTVGVIFSPITLAIAGVSKIYQSVTKDKKLRGAQRNRVENRPEIKGRDTSLLPAEAPKNENNEELVYDNVQNVPLVWEHLSAADPDRKPELTIMVEQPKPGSDVAYDNGEMGHTMLGLAYTRRNRLTNRDQRYRLQYGFYPQGGFTNGDATVAMAGGAIMPGRLKDDYGHDYSISRTYEIDNAKVNAVLRASEQYANGGYGYYKRNCTTFVVDMAKLAEVPVANELEEDEMRFDAGTSLQINGSNAFQFGGRYIVGSMLETKLQKNDVNYANFGQKMATLEDRERYYNTAQVFSGSKEGYSPGSVGEQLRASKQGGTLGASFNWQGVFETGEKRTAPISGDLIINTQIAIYEQYFLNHNLIPEEQQTEQDRSFSLKLAEDPVTAVTKLQELDDPEKYNAQTLREVHKGLSDWRQEVNSYYQGRLNQSAELNEIFMQLLYGLENALEVVDQLYEDKIYEEYDGELKDVRRNFEKGKYDVSYDDGKENSKPHYVKEIHPSLYEGYLQIYGSAEKAIIEIEHYNTICKQYDEAETKDEKKALKRERDACERIHDTAMDFAASHKSRLNKEEYDEKDMQYAFIDLPAMEKLPENQVDYIGMYRNKMTPSSVYQTEIFGQVFDGFGIWTANREDDTQVKAEELSAKLRTLADQPEHKRKLEKILSFYIKSGHGGNREEEIWNSVFTAIQDSYLTNMIVTDAGVMRARELGELIRENSTFKNYIIGLLHSLIHNQNVVDALV